MPLAAGGFSPAMFVFWRTACKMIMKIRASVRHHGHSISATSGSPWTYVAHGFYLKGSSAFAIEGRSFSKPKCLTSLSSQKFLVKVFRTWVTLERGTGACEGFTVKNVLPNCVYLKISHLVLTSSLDSSHSQQREKYEQVIHLLYLGDLSGQDETAPLDAYLLPRVAGSEQSPNRQMTAVRGDESQVPLAHWNI